ncbi:MAG TPA: maleylpyruvate isomerase N-terminal domain-containing protein, partial [Propionibacteriaceae bacterium]|nr:maleylpyruvate isomerase N-terminal domain-containing protein [Propionibacteriaceae bacterium]
ATISAERTELDGLSTAQWDALLLCEGWRVREVMAHITMAFGGAQLLLAACGCQIGPLDRRTLPSDLACAHLPRRTARKDHGWAGLAGAGARSSSSNRHRRRPCAVAVKA